jgi:CheY-like chemotaxis protein
MNGLSNAMKHTTKGSISIKLSAMKDPSRIALAVQDTGHGMSKEFLRRAFKPFAKADSFTTGMGLGLYLVKVMIEDMHGKVDLTSSLGVGTTLAITLPTNLKDSGRGKASIKRDVMHSASDPERRNRRGSDQVMESPREEKQQAVASQTLQPIRKSIRALVVDDNEISRKILVVLLTKQKTCRVEIETAVDGEDGLAKFATFAPHIVLTDVSMPKMDGVTLAQEIRKVEEQDRTRRRSKIYALTGLGSSDPRLKHLALTGNAALDGWFVKGKNKLADIAELVQQVAQST